MSSQLDESTDTDNDVGPRTTLAAALESAADAASDRPLPVLLRDLAGVARDALGCASARIMLRDVDGVPEVFAPTDENANGGTANGENAAGGTAAGGNDEDNVTTPDGGEARISVPLTVRGVEAGELRLAAPHTGEFTETDQRQAENIAAAVGTVIERARTAEANRHREEWYAGGVEIAKEIVAGRDGDPLQLVVRRVAQIARADSVSILQLGATENSLVIVATNSADPDNQVGQEIVVPDAVTSRVMATGRPLAVSHIGQTALPGDVRRRLEADSVAVVPLLGAGAQQGVIVIGRQAGKAPISSAEMGMATMFAGTVALALELAESQTRRDELMLVEERDRIARDLHDHVIQRLYAIGLGMQSVANAADGPLGDRLMGSVDEIDETIKQIRSTIFRLTMPLISSQRSLRARAEALLDDLTPALGFRPRLVSNGPVDFGVDEDIVDDCGAVLREAVTNIARHANATEAEVAISVSAAQLRLEIRDNGVGLGASSRRSGLANLRARAESHDGFMQVRSSAGDGTWLLWSIPLPGGFD